MKVILLVFYISAVSKLFSQSIENVDFRSEGTMIAVVYDFIHPKRDTAINLTLTVFDENNTWIMPKTVSGDLKNVKPGQKKKIIWNVLADGITLSGKYRAEVEIQKSVLFIEGKIPSVKIGNQVWTSENLNVDHYRNGDQIPEAKTAQEWINASKNKQGAWCYYDNNPAYGLKYGKLYNWYAVNDPRGLAPEGWHISSTNDWVVLLKFICGNEAVSISPFNRYPHNDSWNNHFNLKLNMAIKTKYGWQSNGNDSFGFKALPGAQRVGDQSDALDYGLPIKPAGYIPIQTSVKWRNEEHAGWWTSEENFYYNNYAVLISITDNREWVGSPGGPFSSMYKDFGLPVRCVKD
jgi:uncharacterized protein (TIGR02145 family)